MQGGKTESRFGQTFADRRRRERERKAEWDARATSLALPLGWLRHVASRVEPGITGYRLRSIIADGREANEAERSAIEAAMRELASEQK